MIKNICYSVLAAPDRLGKPAGWLAVMLLIARLPMSAADAIAPEMDPFEVTAQSYVIGDAPQSHLSKLEVYNTAGAEGDVNRALQLSPGVSLVDEGNALYIKGGASDETKTFVNDIPFPTTHQSEAPAGTNDPTLAATYMQRTSLYAGGVPVRYGDVLSGAVALETLYPAPQNQVTLNAAVGGASGLLQAPLGAGGGWNLGAGFTDLAVVEKLNPTSFTYGTPPRSGELFISAEVAPAPGLDVQFVGYQKNSDSAFAVTSPSFNGLFQERVRTSFAASRIKGVSSGGWEWKTAAGGGRQVRTESLGTLDLATESTYGAFVADGTKQLSPTVSWGIGANLLLNSGGLRGTVPTTDSLSPSIPPLALDFFRSAQQVAAYNSLSWRPAPKLEVVAGIRTEAFLHQPGGTVVEPRASAAWHISPGTSLQFYSGDLAKAATSTQEATAAGRLHPARAQENSVTLLKKGAHFTLQFSGFLKRYRDLIETNRDFRAVGGNFGRARGFTAGCKSNQISHVILGLDYTLSHSDRTDPDSGRFAASAFDVRQTLSLTSQVRLGYSTVSVAYRFATGKPYTPIAGATAGPALGEFTPIYGAPESERLPDFDRIDLGFNRLQFLHRQLWVPYLSITNVLNTKNTNGYTYSADYRQKSALPSLYRRTVYFGVTTTF
jgi:vitamin B12 transporter